MRGFFGSPVTICRFKDLLEKGLKSSSPIFRCHLKLIFTSHFLARELFEMLGAYPKVVH
jgi:hypothetical protein